MMRQPAKVVSLRFGVREFGFRVVPCCLVADEEQEEQTKREKEELVLLGKKTFNVVYYISTTPI